jgi:hypothetical protein
MLEYQHPASPLTLADGLSEYRDRNSGLVGGRGVSARASEFFRCHDTAHVVFGCSTSLINEAMVKIWSLMGTTVGFRLVREFRLPEAQEIYDVLAWGEIATTAARSLVVVPRVMVHCRRMHRRWPWSDFDAYLERPLIELRAEFGIEVVNC